MEFRILGPLEILYGAKRLELHGVRQQIVVAMLLLNANRPVSMDRLMEAIYGEAGPPTARSQAQISISTVRRQFASCGQDLVISTSPGGYTIQVGGGELDVQLFEDLVAAAKDAGDAGQHELAVARYRDAFRLWRGSALEGIGSAPVRAAASRLDELRISTNEDRVTLELLLGRHHELVGELTELVKKYPFREALRAHLMLALYRCDRTAEALRVYRETRWAMIDELGIEPGGRLQQLELAILASDPALNLPAGPVVIMQPRERVPNLLPADIADFTGREEQVAGIERHLIGEGEQARLAVPVAVVVGQGGIGKTTLAVHASHKVASHFADGQLFADLHGTSGHPVSPTHVLKRFIGAFGVPGGQIPDGLDERAEIYRNLLAARKVLVLLDDAASESQLLPLLPGSATAAVVITSRRRLTGIAGALRVEVEAFAPGQAVDLLAHIAGSARVRGQAEAAAAIAAHCGYLPLALRIAGARLAARPHWEVQRLADRLTDEANRLDELSHGGMGIRSSISLAYEGVSEQARKLFRRLALLNMPVFSGWQSSAVLDEPLTAAEDLLDELVNAQLLEVSAGGSGTESRYRFHDLIRVYARERLAAEEHAADRRAALERALGALLYLAEEARHSYCDGNYARFRSDALRWPLPERLVRMLIKDPRSWYDRERTMLVTAVRQAAQANFTDLCWSLTSSSVPLFESRLYLDDWRESHGIALEAARKARHIRGQAVLWYHMGALHISEMEIDRALAELGTAMRLFKEAGDDQGCAYAAVLLASADRLSGRLDLEGLRGRPARRRRRIVDVRCTIRYRRHADNETGKASVSLHLRQYELPEMRIVTQVLDSTYGTPAAGVRAHLSKTSGNGWVTVAEADTNSDGRIDAWDSRHLERGLYRVVFDSDSYFAGLGTASAYPEVIVVFRMQEESHAFQVQVTLSPYAYTTYFGKLGGQPVSSD